MNENELKHWKYITKEKKNGKWRYYYDHKPMGDDITKRYEKTDGNPNSIYGTYEHGTNYYMVGRNEVVTHPKEIITVKPTKDLFSSTVAQTGLSGYREIVEKVGVIEQHYNSAVKSLSNIIDKGKKWFSKLFK